MDAHPSEIQPVSQLWTAHLNTLKGFYASEVYAVAINQAEAVEKVLAGVRSYVAEQVEDYHTFTTIGCDPDDAEWDDRLAEFYAGVAREAQEKLVAAPSGVVIHVRS